LAAHAPARTGDAVAISLSGLCLAHCLLLPLAAGFAPLLGAWAEAEWVHWGFVAFAIPVSLWTLARARSHNGLSAATVWLAMIGFTLLVAGAAGYPDHEWETPLTVSGGLALAGAHLVNWRRQSHRH
jgi:hypothetical protein